jgi:hypothetical protein
MCCKKGVVLPASQQSLIIPQEISGESEHDPKLGPKATEFRRNIRRYNGALAFTSAMYQADTRVDGFVPFQIQGELYHLQGPLEND